MYELKENLDLQVGALKASLGDCQELPVSLSTFAKLGRAKKSQQWRQRLTRVKAIQFTNHKKQSQLEKRTWQTIKENYPKGHGFASWKNRFI